MPWSNNGTVQVSSGGTIATGTGTTFLSSARVGDALTIAGSTSLHEVTAIASDTQLTFQPPYTGTTGSGKAYRIAPIMGYDKDLSDAFNSIRLQWGTQLSSLQPWATAATADIALSSLGGSQTGTEVFKGSPAAGRTALGLGNAATRAVQTSSSDTTAEALMAVGAFGLGNIGNLPILPQAGLDSFLPTGIYRVATPSGLLDGTYALFNYRIGAALQCQELIAVNVSNRRYQRLQSSTDLAAAWSTVFNSSNILGTVSQSGGVPTGAIIERGSNANGEYVRFADGTQICWLRSFRITQLGSSSTILERAWFFPASFSNTDVVTLVSHSNNVTRRNELNIANFKRAFSDTIVRSDGVRIGIEFTSGVVEASWIDIPVYAIGRWY